METSPSKRRKLSHSTSYSIANRDLLLSLSSQYDQQSFNRMASFMSPTKASLARFNPNLLPPSNRSMSRRHSSSGSVGNNRPRYSGSLLHKASFSKDRASSAEPLAPRVVPRPTEQLTNGLGLIEPQLRRSLSSGSQSAPSSTKYHLQNQNTISKPPEIAVEKAHEIQDLPWTTHPPVAAEINENVPTVHDNNQAAETRGLDKSTNTSQQETQVPVAGTEDGGPILPPTLLQLGLEEPSEPARGILLSSPSRRPKRKKAGLTKSSPIKSKACASESSTDRTARATPILGRRVRLSNTPLPLPSTDAIAQLRMRDKLAGLELQLQAMEDDLIKLLLVSAWNEQGSKEQREISKRQQDITAKSASTKRFRRDLNSIGRIGSEEQGNQAIPEATRTESTPLNGFTKSLTTTPLLLQFASFLPFSERTSRKNRSTDPLWNRRISQTPDSDIPLKVTTSNLSLFEDVQSISFLQSQDILLSSQPQSLIANIRAHIDVSTQLVKALTVLDLSEWSRPELGHWLNSRAFQKNIAVIGAAFGRYWSACQQRAHCWIESAKTFKDLVASNEGWIGECPLPFDAGHPDTMRLLGRQYISFIREEVVFDVKWLIAFDESGEVENQISVNFHVPEAWRQLDDGNAFDKIEEAFGMLKEEGGVIHAVNVLCRSLFPTWYS